MTDNQKIADILRRREYFQTCFPAIEGSEGKKTGPLPNSCPFCGYLTLDTRSGWVICSFCFWEDDGQDNHDADLVYGGPNGEDSLTAYRLRLYDWMTGLKRNTRDQNTAESLIGSELLILDSYIAAGETNRRAVLDKIRLLAALFDKLRNVGAVKEPDWKFLPEENKI